MDNSYLGTAKSQVVNFYRLYIGKLDMLFFNGSLVISMILLSFGYTFGQRNIPSNSRPEEFRLSIIHVEEKGQAQEILQKLNEGTSFAELARLYSVGPERLEGGDIGYIALDDLSEEFNSIAINLRVKEYSGIIKTIHGYFIILKTEQRFKEQTPLSGYQNVATIDASQGDEVYIRTELNKQSKDKDVKELLRSFCFHEAHQVLLRRIKSRDNEAHFELSRTLLMELAWASVLWHRGKGLPPGIKKMIGPNPLYSAFDQDRDGELVLQENRIGTLPIYSVIVELWKMKDYPRLVVHELEQYLLSKAPQNRVTAEKWKKSLTSAIQHATGAPIPPLAKDRGINQDEYERIKSVSSIMTRIEMGEIEVELLPTE